MNIDQLHSFVEYGPMGDFHDFCNSMPSYSPRSQRAFIIQSILQENPTNSSFETAAKNIHDDLKLMENKLSQSYSKVQNFEVRYEVSYGSPAYLSSRDKSSESGTNSECLRVNDGAATADKCNANWSDKLKSPIRKAYDKANDTEDSDNWEYRECPSTASSSSGVPPKRICLRSAESTTEESNRSASLYSRKPSSTSSCAPTSRISNMSGNNEMLNPTGDTLTGVLEIECDKTSSVEEESKLSPIYTTSPESCRYRTYTKNDLGPGSGSDTSKMDNMSDGQFSNDCSAKNFALNTCASSDCAQFGSKCTISHCDYTHVVNTTSDSCSCSKVNFNLDEFAERPRNHLLHKKARRNTQSPNRSSQSEEEIPGNGNFNSDKLHLQHRHKIEDAGSRVSGSSSPPYRIEVGSDQDTEKKSSSCSVRSCNLQSFRPEIRATDARRADIYNRMGERGDTWSHENNCLLLNLPSPSPCPSDCTTTPEKPLTPHVIVSKKASTDILSSEQRESSRVGTPNFSSQRSTYRPELWMRSSQENRYILSDVESSRGQSGDGNLYKASSSAHLSKTDLENDSGEVKAQSAAFGPQRAQSQSVPALATLNAVFSPHRNLTDCTKNESEEEEDSTFKQEYMAKPNESSEYYDSSYREKAEKLLKTPLRSPRRVHSSNVPEVMPQSRLEPGSVEDFLFKRKMQTTDWSYYSTPHDRRHCSLHMKTLSEITDEHPEPAQPVGVLRNWFSRVLRRIRQFFCSKKIRAEID